MKTKHALKYTAAPAKVIMTGLIFLIILLILQVIVCETIWMISYTGRANRSKSELNFTPEEERIIRIRTSEKEFLPDWTIHLVQKSTRNWSSRDRSESVQIYDVNDNLLWEGPLNQKPYEYISWASTPSSYIEAFSRQQMKKMQEITPEFSRILCIPVNSSDRTEEVWQYLPDSRYFVGYNIGGEIIGYIGSSGFTDSKSKVKPFDEFGSFTAWCPHDSYSPTVLWQTQREVYQINFEKQRVDLIFESADSDIDTISLHAWRDFKPGTKDYVDREKYRPLLLCVTKDGIHHLILREPEQYLPLDIPRSSVTVTKNDIFLSRFDNDVKPPPENTGSQELYEKWLRELRNKTRKYWVELYKMDDHGDLELLNRFNWAIPPRPETSFNYRLAAQRYTAQFSPPFYDIIMRFAGRKLWTYIRNNWNREDLFRGLANMILEFRPRENITNLILSLLMMAFMFFHGWSRRTSSAKFVFWLIFVGLFNLAGLMTYLAMNHTPTIECPSCGKKRGIDRIDCVRCKTELPAHKPGKLDLIYNT
jgi:hypothetical protein